MPNWLASIEVPLFVSDRRLRSRKTLPTALGVWSLDSGGFTELQQYGSWDNGPTPGEYVDRVRRYQSEIGGLQWAAPQDWMCEPLVIKGGTLNGRRFAGTGLSVLEHQKRTVENLLELRRLAPELPFIPVLQGFTRDEYLRCIRIYGEAGINLGSEATVGLGSVCRRQGTQEIEDVISTVVDAVPGIRLHGFGVKTRGLARYSGLLESADSMAWSYSARNEPRMVGCSGHKNCANCLRFALDWRRRVLREV